MDAGSRQRDGSAGAVVGSSASGGKSKRHSWSFINVSRSGDASPSRKGRERASLVVPKTILESRSKSSSNSGPSSAPQTRSSSPERSELQPQPRPRSSRGPTSSLQVPNFSKNLPSRPGTRGLPTILESKTNTASMESLRSRIDGSKVKRWDGHMRTSSPWNGIRRDSELFFEKGNCVVHLHAKGQSQRGPSIRIPLDTIYTARFDFIFATFYAEIASGGKSGSRLFVGAPKPSKSTLCELFIPTPDHITRADALIWHLTTRNFFAFLMDRPLVGSSLGEALIDLQERLDLVRPHDPNNHPDLLAYLERAGYLEFAHCPDYSLALLHFAERFEMQELWIDAFVHCVGMNGMLTLSQEFNKISTVTKALITRAYLEMDLHLGRITRALSNFLEDDFSPAHLGLSSAQRAHLDRFRSFLHSYYVEKFGYWPPPAGSRFAKALYKSMYFDFRALYDFLVDLDSSDSLTDQKPASGGICVLQNVQAFDTRHKYIPLPHPLPLLPEYTGEARRTQSQRALRSLKIGTKQVKTEQYFTSRDALAAATNSADLTITFAPLVKEYKRFERECTRRPEEKISLRDARKVRWIVIYGTLQMLVSVIRAPKEVRDVDSPAYPLCCLVAGTPPWLGGAKALNSPHMISLRTPVRVSMDGFDASLPLSKTNLDTPEPMIEPDCQTDDYFTHTRTRTPSLSDPALGLQRAPSNGESRRNMFRNSSFRSVKSFSFSSFGSRRNSQVVGTAALAPVPSRKHSEILVHGYGNGLSNADLIPLRSDQIPIEYSTESFPELVPEIIISPQSPPDSRPVSSHAKRESSLRRRTYPDALMNPGNQEIEEPQRTPTLNCLDVEKLHDPMNGRVEEMDCPSDNSISAPVTPNDWSSRSPSPSSSSTSLDDINQFKDRRSSTFSTNSTLLASPVELPIDKDGGITISRTFSVKRFTPQEMELQDAITMAPLSLDDDPVPEVYQPSGFRSGASLRKQSASVNLRKTDSGNKRQGGFGSLRNGGFGSLSRSTETSAKNVPKPVAGSVPPPVIKNRSDLPSSRSDPALVKEISTERKGVLKRSDAVAGIREKRRRSVRIKDDVDLLGGIIGSLDGVVA